MTNKLNNNVLTNIVSLFHIHCVDHMSDRKEKVINNTGCLTIIGI